MKQLKQGTTPTKIAESITVGVVIGVLPVVGVTTVLCALLGWRLRLNQPVLQLVNGLLYPVQLALIMPFAGAGEALFGRLAPLATLSTRGLWHVLLMHPWRVMDHYGVAVGYGIVVWAVVVPPAGIALYLGLKPVLRRLARRIVMANVRQRPG